MQTETISVPTGTPARVISAAEINRIAIELGQLGNTLVDTGIAMIQKALELGESLTHKKAEIDRVSPGTWQAWCSENIDFSDRHNRNYRALYADRQRVAVAIAAGEVTSLRTAIAILGSDANDEKTEIKSYGATPVKQSKLGRAMAKFWTAIHRRPPESWDKIERADFLIDLSEREKIRIQQGWKAFEVIIK